MKTIHSLGDLRQFGIDCLTGEACALNRRLLCDLTAEGKNLIEKVLGIEDIKLAGYQNGGVGSILLERETMWTAAILAMLLGGCVEVWQSDYDGSLHGIESPDELELARANEGNTSEHNWRKYRLFRGVTGLNPRCF